MIKINIKFYLKFILLLQFLFLFNCTGVKEKVGIIKKAPDEFQVYEKKPLAVPPNFELRPPVDKDLVEDDTEDEIIFKKEANNDEYLTIEDEVLLISIGEKDIDQNIREVINNENSISEIEKPLLDKILDFEPIIEVKAEENNELDPNAEKERINQLKVEGKLIDSKKEKTIIEELKSEINNLEIELKEVENDSLKENKKSKNITIENTANLENEKENINSDVADEDESFLDQIFDFDLFGTDEKEVENDSLKESKNSKNITTEKTANIDNERKNINSDVADEDESILDQIFDFDLFGTEEKEVEAVNQRDKTFFNKNRDDDKNVKEPNSNNVSKEILRSEDRKVEAVISEKEGSID